MPLMIAVLSPLEVLVDYAQIIGAGATVVGVVAVAVAIWTICESRYATANGWMLELDKIFVDRPKMREEFFDSNNSYDDKKHELAAFTEYVADSTDFFLRHRFRVGTWKPNVMVRMLKKLRLDKRLGISGMQRSWESWVFKLFENSRVLREFLCQNKDCYRPRESALGTLFERWCNDQKKKPKLPSPVEPTGSG
jgi:hypothetical protein